MEKTRKIKGSVRTAVGADLPFIQEWSTREARNGDGFINNWSVIQKACAEKQMTVFFTLEGPVGFLTYGISHGTILQTKSSCQQRGIGRKLVEHAIRKEEALNNTVLVVQCEPHSSVEFWSQMGFEVHRGGWRLKATKVNLHATPLEVGSHACSGRCLRNGHGMCLPRDRSELERECKA